MQGDLLLFVADSLTVAAEVLGRLRSQLGPQLYNVSDTELAFVWVLDFPLFEWDAEGNRWDAVHHPFTAPPPRGRASARQRPPAQPAPPPTDMVLNGYEVGGGLDPHLRPRDAGEGVLSPRYTQEAAWARFGHLLRAFEFGVPPHGGDRARHRPDRDAAAGADNIREVMAFPKTNAARDLMTDAPSSVATDQLRDLHLAVVMPPEKK